MSAPAVPSNTLHYRRLHAQVSEVRARAPPDPDFDPNQFVTERGHFDYWAFLAALFRQWSHFYAGDKIDLEEPSSEFHLSQFLTSVDRLSEVAEPYQRFGSWLFRIATWTYFYETAFYFVIYWFCLYYGLLLPVVMGFLLFVMIRHRLDPNLDWGFNSPMHDPIAEPSPAPRWRGLPTRTSSGITVNPKETTKDMGKASKRSRTKLISELWELWRTRMGYVVHREMKDRTEILEKVRNAVKWRDPRASLFVVGVLIFYILASLCLSLQFLAKYAGFCVGLEFFLLFRLRVRYPRYRRLFSVLNWHVWPVPDDATLAMRQLRAAEIPVHRTSSGQQQLKPDIPLETPVPRSMAWGPSEGSSIVKPTTASDRGLPPPIPSPSPHVSAIRLPVQFGPLHRRNQSDSSVRQPIIRSHSTGPGCSDFPDNLISLPNDGTTALDLDQCSRDTESPLSPFRKMKHKVQQGARKIRALSHNHSRISVVDPTDQPTAPPQLVITRGSDFSEETSDSSSMGSLASSNDIPSVMQRRNRVDSSVAVDREVEGNPGDPAGNAPLLYPSAHEPASGSLEFRCMHRGVPGYLVITPHELFFRKSRALGGGAASDPIPLDWVTGVRKAQSINLLVYKSPGLHVKLTNKQTVSFSNVLRRDEAFHTLIVRCGKQWQNI
ncbi:hypothetical protein BJ085DRAFT_36057 [Dimargaris cristalligena]|uniref:GRAM domain-containing protein n=1 Tax=Dimargaris cristalligena TaxID=215637 RepID=A0A4P9ZQM9_9FUNG|nr:hypothetical protein BJ085DRAFT_36057 [Dimargaris cristalligena]|eukprot:RKP35041.1 hypothetical protein BJ085DRAFT_36057 [Dimargaris cristalligena]